jgi:hypothetical protein
MIPYTCGIKTFSGTIAGECSCSIPSFCFKFWNKKIVLFVLIEISEGIKTF